MTPMEKNGSVFFSSSNFSQKIKGLLENYDQIFICSDIKDSVAGLMALQPFNPTLVLLTRTKKTKKSELLKIKNIQPIGILIND